MFEITNRIPIVPLETDIGRFWMIVNHTSTGCGITFYAKYKNEIDISSPIHVCKWIKPLVDKRIQELLNFNLIVGTRIGPEDLIFQEIHNIIDAFANMTTDIRELAFSEQPIIINDIRGVINHSINPNDLREHLLQILLIGDDKCVIDKYKNFHNIVCATIDRNINFYLFWANYMKNLNEDINIPYYDGSHFSLIIPNLRKIGINIITGKTPYYHWVVPELSLQMMEDFKKKLKDSQWCSIIDDISVHEDFDKRHIMRVLPFKNRYGNIFPLTVVVQLESCDEKTFFEAIVDELDTKWGASLFPRGKRSIEHFKSARPFIYIDDINELAKLESTVKHELAHFAYSEHRSLYDEE